MRFATKRDATRYSMNHKKRGKCVIFNQVLFDWVGSERKGSNFDVKMISRTFRSLGFELDPCHNLSYSKIMEKVDELCKENHKDCDCICFFILTHGSEENWVRARDVSYQIRDIWKKFTADNCPSLASKPKLFFIQACRGTKNEKPVRGRSVTDSSKNEEIYNIPSHADFLYASSTVEGFNSRRDPEKGTWYIQTLCEVIQDHWRDTDLLRMLTITARKVATTEYPDEEALTQMPSTTTTLIRDLYFTPKDES
ncbi:PREDICTED: caspase-like [Eufriesea mexicana]|nr:PREDICTED: caspase-like [Eufriesea mexicana]